MKTMVGRMEKTFPSFRPLRNHFVIVTKKFSFRQVTNRLENVCVGSNVLAFLYLNYFIIIKEGLMILENQIAVGHNFKSIALCLKNLVTTPPTIFPSITNPFEGLFVILDME